MAHILVADDDIAIRGFLKSALEKNGHTIDACEDGTEALTLLKNGPHYDLLLTDIVMPNMDGLELSNQARKLYPKLKIMYITGFSGLLENSENNENIQVISKPFHLKDIVTQVNTTLSK